LAQAAVPSLEAVENEGLQSLNQDLPWRELFKRNQSLEWFKADGKLLARRDYLLDFALDKASRVIQQQGQTHLTIAVYADNLNKKTLQLQGYIRASESTKEVEQVLMKLAWDYF